MAPLTVTDRTELAARLAVMRQGLAEARPDALTTDVEYARAQLAVLLHIGQGVAAILDAIITMGEGS